MNQSASPVVYFVPPPSVPEYMYKLYPMSICELVDWAKAEHQRWITISTKKGYWKTVKYLSDEYSAIRLLAEMQGFRKVCALIQQSPRDVWNSLPNRYRKFVFSAYQLRDLLLRD